MNIPSPAKQIGGLAALFAFASVPLLLALIKRRAVIGDDGIRIRWLFRSRLVRYRDLRRARPNEDKTRVTIDTTEGKSYELLSDETVPDELLSRLWQSIAAGAEAAPRSVEEHALRRCGRTTTEWRSALRELAKPAGYRETKLSPDRLWTIAENPGLEPEIRAAAIVALSGNLEPARVRVIVATTVEPALRLLLEADDEEAIERGLDAV